MDAAVFPEVDLEGTELDSFEAAEIEEKEFIEDERLESIIESILFASDRPVGLGSLKMVFKGTNIRTEKHPQDPGSSGRGVRGRAPGCFAGRSPGRLADPNEGR